MSRRPWFPHRGRAAGLVCALVVALCAPASAASASAARTSSHQVVTWGASADRMGTAVADHSYRPVVRTSVGGGNPRIRLSNAFDDPPVTFDSIYAGQQKDGAQLVPGSSHRLTFSGGPAVTLAPGATVYSDALAGSLGAQSNLVISLHVVAAEGPATGHGMAMQTSYAAGGDHAGEEGAGSWTERIGSWFYLDAVSVETGAQTGAVVTLGDSITDGWQSSTDTNRRWPDYLSRRLQGAAGTGIKGVANEGISGSKVLADGAGQSALGRLQRDVLSQPGIRTVFLFEGINDIKAHSGVTVADLVAGYRQIIDRAHAAGACVVGARGGPDPTAFSDGLTAGPTGPRRRAVVRLSSLFGTVRRI
ncbi:GDSL-type esterase/lipase family protein [Streptomyces sp. H10-C2]|uniref:GDSL-type esterase/lipase family protein n=1 Tax=unclassified Streptomyces TaxID=2593676 RepID=UPI0024BAC4FE|nr:MULTISPECIES: GDSL-type esterase/lipase family protein [unclassified Streptomyces]MDJ0345682.1 GDSL-type esterase/lipase family protein [Streptomyces sp. PH10-H1]MDJ0374534.1 GDSL-type esterase/lipase family protein [Streptomyces sp. H10-C2]